MHCLIPMRPLLVKASRTATRCFTTMTIWFAPIFLGKREEAKKFQVHRGSRYVTSLKMYSSRTLNAECVNSQNVYDHLLPL